MRIAICDRCGKKIYGGKHIGHISATMWTDGGIPIASNPYEKWDLCEDCMKKIALLIDGTIDVQLEPEALPAEALPAEANAAVEALTEAMEKEMQKSEDADPEEEEDEDAEDSDEEAEAIRRIAGTPPNAKPVNLRECGPWKRARCRFESGLQILL